MRVGYFPQLHRDGNLDAKLDELNSGIAAGYNIAECGPTVQLEVKQSGLTAMSSFL